MVAQLEQVHHLSSITVEHMWQVHVLGLAAATEAGGLGLLVLAGRGDGPFTKTRKSSAGLSAVQASQDR